MKFRMFKRLPCWLDKCDGETEVDFAVRVDLVARVDCLGNISRIVFVDEFAGDTEVIVKEDFFTVISRLNTIAE